MGQELVEDQEVVLDSFDSSLNRDLVVGVLADNYMAFDSSVSSLDIEGALEDRPVGEQELDCDNGTYIATCIYFCWLAGCLGILGVAGFSEEEGALLLAMNIDDNSISPHCQFPLVLCTCGRNFPYFY
jgi:hypothetical protein